MPDYFPSNNPWATHQEDPFVADSPGGITVVFGAGSQLNIGDVVFLTGVMSVAKSNVEANYTAAIGVVVGGTNTDMRVVQDDVDIGRSAAEVGEKVLVCVLGKAKVVSDAAIAAGAKLTVGTVTAGRVATATITTEAVAGDTGRILGIALESPGGAAVKFLMLVNPH